jgi:hypothetical protein
MDENLLKAATENFDLPHDIIMLPSKGRFYKSKKKSVKIGYLTASDEDLIVSGSRNKSNIVLSLIRNKLYERDIRPDEMLECDIEAILLFLRNSSFGYEYNLLLTDPKTGKSFEHTEILDELDFKITENEPDDNGYFTTKLPKTGATVKLKLLTYSEILELEDMSDKYPEHRIVPKVTWRLLKQIISVNDNEDRGLISDFVNDLPIMDSKHIRNFLSQNQPSIDLKRIAIAPSGEKVSFDITFGVDFFRPFF